MKKTLVTVFIAIAVAAVIFLLALIGGKNNITHSTFTGMGTVIDIKLYGKADDELLFLSELFEKTESICSVRNSQSAASLLNGSGCTDNTMLLDQAEECIDVYNQSNGAFDFTVGKLSSLWSIGFPEQRIPEGYEIEDALMYVGSDLVTLTDSKLYLSEDQYVDFGAVTKGYACDLAKSYLDKTDVGKAVISVGGSLLFYGKKTGGWSVAVRDPFNEALYACTFKLEEGFVSTSGSYERFFEENGKVYHHIIDPHTGMPAESTLKSVTVVADSGALSDALSTACFILGIEKGEELLKKYNASGIFIGEDGSLTAFGDITPENVKQ